MSDTPALDHAALEAVRILLVEDDAGDALLMQQALSGGRHGAFHLRRVDSLSAALRESARGGVDLVLLDLGLPDSRGLDTFVRLRAAAAGVPIIVLTGLDDESLATVTVQQGAQDYIVKGQADGASLARSIRYAMERSRIRQALNAERDRLRSVIDNIPDQVYLKDKDSRFVAVNLATARFFGASSPDHVVGKCDVDFFPRELAAQFLVEEQSLLRRGEACVNREADITDSAGRTRWMLTTKVPLRDQAGNVTGLLGINRDITERKEAEEAIRRLNAELERRVTERTAELAQAVGQLQEQERHMASFVATVTHELQTPVAAINFGVTNLLRGVAGTLPEKALSYCTRIKEDCLRLEATIGDVLELSRINAKTLVLHREPVDLRDLVQQVVERIRFQAEEQGQVLAVDAQDGPLIVSCDRPRIARAVLNVVRNAVKFTPEGGRVAISVRCLAGGRAEAMLLCGAATWPHADSAAVVRVVDTGMGIPADQLAHVTERYFRGDPHVEGTGLGLAICKEIVEAHGGCIRLCSPPAGQSCGTEVTILLPLA